MRSAIATENEMPPTGSERGKRRAREAGADAGSIVESNHRGGPGQPLIDLDFVRGLIAAVDESGIDSLEISRAGTRIRVSKTPPPAAVATASTPAALHVAGAAQPAASVPSAVPSPGEPTAQPSWAGAADAAASASEAKSDLHEVKSPMVGTFYRAPAPEAPPYVETGSAVSKGQTLCILEAMKLMNEMESDVDGVIREILVENAEPVEYGQVLFRVELAGPPAR